MGLLDVFKIERVDINGVIEKMKSEPGAVLLDVRETDEYRSGHIPGSINLPLRNIAEALTMFPDKTAPIYTYCLSGSRSGKAVSILKAAGYKKVTNVGGIRGYQGALEQ